MAVDLIKIGEKLIAFLQKKRELAARERAECLQAVRSACEELIEIPDPKSDRAKYLHEQLKVLYESTRGYDSRAINLHSAIASARMYYWLRQVDVDDQQ